MSLRELELILFATREPLVRQALAGGLESFIVDLEWRGKEERQQGADTEINRDSPEDLRRLAAWGVPRRYCRLNRFGPWTRKEAEAVLAAGATSVLLPMVEGQAEVERLHRWLDGRCALGVLVETAAAVAKAPELARLPLDLVDVGLNDLAISRGTPSIFTALADGTVERLREAFREQRFGFGGVTVVDGGRPILCRLLVAEMARLECGFSFLRRSFRRDVAGRCLGTELGRLRELWRQLLERDGEERAADRRALLAALQSAPAVAGGAGG